MSTEETTTPTGLDAATADAATVIPEGDDPSLEGWMSAHGYAVAVSVTEPGVAEVGKPPFTAEPINITETGKNDRCEEYSTISFRTRGARVSLTRPRGSVFSKDLLGLATFGAPVNGSNMGQLHKFLQMQEAQNVGRIPLVRIYEPGWSADRTAYTYGNQVLGRNDGRAAGNIHPDLAAALAPRGDLPTYLNIAAEARDRSTIAEAHWAAAYAAPLLRLLETRGFVLSVWGESGNGKSAVQALGASAWGRPSTLNRTGNQSEAAAGILFASLNDCLVWIDDTQQAQQTLELARLIYLAGNGTSAGRATSDGLARASRNWSCITLISGEKPMLDHGAAQGAQNRSIELNTPPLPQAEMSVLHRRLEEHHGLTGPLFVEALLERIVRPNELHRLREINREVQSALGAPAESASAQISLLVVADMLARAYVWGENEDLAEKSALRFGKELLGLASAEKKEVGTPFEEQYESFRSFVAINEEAFDPHPAVSKKFGKFLDDAKTVAVLDEVFAGFCKERKYSERALARWLKDKGLLITDGKDYKPKVQIGKSRPRCYRIVLEPGSVLANSPKDSP